MATPNDTPDTSPDSPDAPGAGTTLVRGRWFPASVKLPDGRVLRRAYVVLGEGGEHHGLHVYTRPDERTFHAPINWRRQPPIPTGRRAKTGIDLQLTNGTVAVVTPATACRCGALGRWAGPAWSNRVAKGAKP